MRTKYYYHSPRGFSNEWNIYRVKNASEVKYLPNGSERISAKEARKRIARKHWLDKQNSSYPKQYGNFFPLELISIDGNGIPYWNNPNQNFY